VPYPGKKKLDREIGGSGIHLTEAEADHKRSDLVREVKISFVRVLAADRLATVAEEVSQVAETASATARKRVEAGATGLQEQLRAEIQWEQARAGLDHLRGEAAVARQTLAALLGTSDLFQTTLIGTLVETRQANLLETSTDLLDRHPGLVVARKQVSQAELEEKRTRLDPYPDVKVGINGGRVGSTGESIIGINFMVPIPLIDRGKGKKQEARGNVETAEAGLAVARYHLQRDLAQARKRYQNTIEQVEHYRERILPKASEALRLVQRGFEEGKFNFIDYLETQRTTAEVRLAYQQKVLELNLARTELETLINPQTNL
jgi:cobalt-zinc-cadmium efflux system outer membrane protein